MGSVGSSNSNGPIDYSRKSLKKLGDIMENSNDIEEIEDIKAELYKRVRNTEDIDVKYPMQRMINRADTLTYELRRSKKKK